MQQGRLNLLSDNECLQHLTTLTKDPRTFHNFDLGRHTFCAGSIPTLQGINVCKVECENIKFMNCLKLFAFQGDSGGPYACKNERRIWTLVGIITSTFTEKTGLPCALSFFTKVDQYLDFINTGDFMILIAFL